MERIRSSESESSKDDAGKIDLEESDESDGLAKLEVGSLLNDIRALKSMNLEKLNKFFNETNHCWSVLNEKMEKLEIYLVKKSSTNTNNDIKELRVLNQVYKMQNETLERQIEEYEQRNNAIEKEIEQLKIEKY